MLGITKGRYVTNINMRDNQGKIRSKDILLMELDMEVESANIEFVLRLNRNYVLDQKFTTEKKAENELIRLAKIRNTLEDELCSND